MSIQQFCLKWNNHQPNFISVFKSFLNTKSLVDVTLSAEGQQMYAHKVVLSACSVYFQSLFAENPSDHPIVILKDVKYTELQILVDFIYCGEVNVSEDQLPQILETAKTLKIKGLTEMPDTSLTRSQSGGGEFPVVGEELEQIRNNTPPCSPAPTKTRRSSVASNMETDYKLCDGAMAPGMQTLPLDPQQPQRRRTPHEQYHAASGLMADVSQQTEEQAIQANNILASNNISQIMCVPEMLLSASVQRRRPRCLQRQSRVRTDSGDIRLKRTASHPLPSSFYNEPGTSKTSTNLGPPPLLKHSSHPPMAHSNSKVRVVSVSQQERPDGGGGGRSQRARHTPTMRLGPPLSCNFCWNTVDDCGRILRRKTQYHCPECRTNLCIVPCFHEYHEGPRSSQLSSPRTTTASR